MTTIFLSLLCLLAFSTSAAAECAWVLWRSVSVGKLEAQVPTLAGAFPAFNDCTAAARRDYVQMGAPHQVAASLTDNPGGAFRGKTKDGNDLFVWNQCLPDTMDPRGPKK